jgi:hypothetical protein
LLWFGEEGKESCPFNEPWPITYPDLVKLRPVPFLLEYSDAIGSLPRKSAVGLTNYLAAATVPRSCLD